VLQCVAVCCSVFVTRHISVCFPMCTCRAMIDVRGALQCVAVCCSVLQCVLQCVAECCSVVQSVAMRCHAMIDVPGALQCVAACCSVLQCVAVYFPICACRSVIDVLVFLH